MPTEILQTQGPPMSMVASATVVNVTTRRRRVRFHPDAVSQVVGIVLCLDDFTREEKASYWWSASDQQHFRARASIIVRAARNKSEGIRINLIDDSYKTARDVERLKEHAVNDLLQDPSQYTKRLEIWAKSGDLLSGLERCVSQFQRLERRADCNRYKRIVLRMRESSSWDNLGVICARNSIRSRFYARMVGHAHEQALAYPRQATDIVQQRPWQSIENTLFSNAVVIDLPPSKRVKQSNWSRVLRMSKSIVSI